MDTKVRVGMAVVDADGKRLGKVTRCGPRAFEVIRRFWSPYEWVIRWDEVLDVKDGVVRVARCGDELIELAEGGLPHGWPHVQPDSGGPLPATPSEAETAAAVAEGLPDSGR